MANQNESIIQFINRRLTIIYLVILVISLPIIYFISVAQMEKETMADLDMLTATLQEVSPGLVSGSQVGMNSPTVKLVDKFLNAHESFVYRFVPLGTQADDELFSSHYPEIEQHINMGHGGDISGRLTDGRMELIYKVFPVSNFYNSTGYVLLGIQKDRLGKAIMVRVATFIGLMSVLYAIIISSINTSLRSRVINPLIRINNRTRNVANGQIDKVFQSDRKDEIGELIKSIELLRRSLSISMDIYKKQSGKKPPGKTS